MLEETESNRKLLLKMVRAACGISCIHVGILAPYKHIRNCVTSNNSSRAQNAPAGSQQRSHSNDIQNNNGDNDDDGDDDDDANKTSVSIWLPPRATLRHLVGRITTRIHTYTQGDPRCPSQQQHITATRKIYNSSQREASVCACVCVCASVCAPSNLPLIR